MHYLQAAMAVAVQKILGRIMTMVTLSEKPQAVTRSMMS